MSPPSPPAIRGSNDPYRESLARYSPFYLVLDLFVIAAILFYRGSVYALLEDISPDLVLGEGHGGYASAAFSTDMQATAFVLTALALAWLLTPILKKTIAIVSMFAVLVYSSFMIFMTDFVRVYRTAFARGYIGGEHFTGINSMLISAAAELSTEARVALIASTVLLAAFSMLTLRKAANNRAPLTRRVKTTSSLAAFSVLTACLLVNPPAKSGAGEKTLSSVRIRGEELGGNPLSSRYSMYGKSMIFHEYHDVDVHTLPEVLSENGYSNCFIHTGDLLYASRKKFLADRNIDTFKLYDDLIKDRRYAKKVGWGADERSMIGPAVEWAKTQSTPYLLMMAPVNPHHPYAIPEDFQKIADPDDEGISAREKTWRKYLNSLHYAACRYITVHSRPYRG